MGKVFSVDLGGKTRELRYRMPDRKELENRFGMGLQELISQKVVPVNAEGRGTGGGLLDAQVALLFIGLRHNGPAITEARVLEWMEREIEGGGSIFAALNTSVLAVMASGVLGMKWEPPEPEEEVADAEVKTAAGKADAEPEVP